MVSIDYLAYGFKRLFRKPILEVIHFGFYNSRLIPIHVHNKLMLKRKGDLRISDYEFAINILGLNLSDNSGIYESVYQYTLTKDKNSFFFDSDSTLLKEDYLSNYSLDLCYYADAVLTGSGRLQGKQPAWVLPRFLSFRALNCFQLINIS
ncbi:MULTISPECIES: hypothetical protein [unclassified Methanosarcina]|uniref:hypothetical protein n=1 Tax=unclassified Methanosarcina TaxID=2644672 RepID=UPI000A67343E|nr:MULTISPECIES: hypothetical protein [unclassified Methanosarcina]